MFLFRVLQGLFPITWAQKDDLTKVHLENGWNSKRMITEGEAAIPLETTRRAFGNKRNQNKDQL